MTEQDFQRRDAEHQRYLARIRVAIRQRLTARGSSEAEIERYLADLPDEPIAVVVQRMMAARQT